MEIKPSDSVEAKSVTMGGAEGVTMRMLIGPDQNAPNFNMRLFEVAPGGHSPLHSHDWEHEVYILTGTGAAGDGEHERPVAAGDCVFIPAGETHQLVNKGRGPLKFLCLVPRDSG